MAAPRGEIEPIGELIRARRQRLGLSQAELAQAICAIDQPTVTGNEVARWERGKRIPRIRARRALAQALTLPDRLVDLAAAAQRLDRAGEPVAALAQHDGAVPALRAVLLDNANFAGMLIPEDDFAGKPPPAQELRRDLAEVMAAYQASRYGEMLSRLPELLTGAHLAARASSREPAENAQRLLALACQACATILTKLGELDLAWVAADRGLAAAQQADDRAVLGSLHRSVIHTLQAHGRTGAASRLTERSADDLRQLLTSTSQRSVSIYGTLLLTGAMAAARANDRHAANGYLDEADHHAQQMGHDANHLWTAFGPTNVAIHRVATAVVLDDLDSAHHHTDGIDPTRLPIERQVRYAFDLARVWAARGEIDRCVTAMLSAERLAPEQVHNHVMSNEVLTDLRRSREGERHPALAGLAQRIHATTSPRP